MWSQLIWLDPANWSGTALGSPDTPLGNEIESPSAIVNIETLSSHSSDGEEDEEEMQMDSAQRNEYDFLDDINEEIENDINYTAPVTTDGNEESPDGETHLEDLDESGNKVEGSWDLISYLPAAASVYLRHTIGTLLLLVDNPT